ncbi:MAG: hydantoinase/oxoprolinase family protein [Alphaproteobacteria bacterium]|nr:hydantoinase/oxoprolinase family protein [Alphaproteobacteria bacterium]
MSYRVGVDIGGSFTDFCVLEEETRRLISLKVLSTPFAPGQEVVDGIRELERRFGIRPADISYFTHGTTVGINSVIQRKGIDLWLFATEFFCDVLEMARLKMPDPYDIFSRRPAPLVPRHKVLGIRERMLADGTVDVPLDRESLAAAVETAQRAGAEGIVVSFLHAYRNPAHEREAIELITELAPEIAVSSATEVWPAVREYERTMTALVAGYVQPRVSHYLSSLQRALSEIGVPAEAFITTSNGGVMRAELGKKRCAQMLLSGTASGVIGASYVAAMCGRKNVMSFDVGGTSVDVAFIIDGKAQYGTGELVGEFPIFIPTVSVTSVGEGGGSIARLDRQGVLKVGPESAGSTPGPACYGKGGTQPTITDAFAVCGHIGQADLGYNAIKVDVDKARQALATIASALGLGVEQTAEAVIEVATSGTYVEVAKLVSRYGLDPADFSLVAFGGAGPMLACFLARELGIKEVVVPPTPGVLSAFGGLVADIKSDFIRTVYLDMEPTVLDRLKESYDKLKVKATDWLTNEQAYEGPATLLYSAEMRYRGQSYEIEVPFDESWIENGDWNRLIGAFHSEHERIYGYSDPASAAQIMNLRLVIVGTVPRPELPSAPLREAVPVPARQGRLFLSGRWLDAPLYERSELKPGHRFEGPAVVMQADATTCIPESFAADVDSFGNLCIRPTN